MAMKVANKNDYYYDAMELLDTKEDGAKQAEKLLLDALKFDENYVQTHLGLVYVYRRLGQKKKEEKYTKLAYENTLKKFPKWPSVMVWGIIENRAYMRAIQARAELFVDDGEQDKGTELYRLLLKLNPNDNQGIRYVLAGLYAGISGDEINNMFDEGNEKQNWSALEKLVEKQNKKHKFWAGPMGNLPTVLFDSMLGGVQ
ncbi:MAG: hypothetical protein HZB10_01185 [Candidatus Yonathbacteria bacterium]|nr:hypothetical protein [Candidatus Yonathbacteria bacterium]